MIPGHPRGWTVTVPALVAAVAALALAACGNQTSATTPAAASTSSSASAPATESRIPSGDWTTFDYNAQRSGVGPADTGITAANLHNLRLRTVHLDGTVDSSAVELHSVRVDGRVRDVAIMTTSYGITIALDPGTGKVLWHYVPNGTVALEGTPQITTSAPTVDPGRRYVYVTSPNGYVHKLVVATGRVVWSRSVTFDPTHEKLAGGLNIEGRSLIVTTDGYDGDTPSYQGHVVTIDRSTGRITHLFNTLCSNIGHLIDPPSACRYSDSAIWGRPGSVVEPGTGQILVATSNGQSDSTVSFNGATNWSDSVLELSPTLKLLHNWTPADQLRLTQQDLDLGSSSPALLPKVDGLRLAVQGGKAGVLSLLDLNHLDGTTAPAGPRTGGELQDIASPGAGEVLTQPAVWTHSGHIYVFVANFNGTAAYGLGSDHRLHLVWEDSTPGTSPVLAGGLLYVYDPNGALVIRSPVSGRELDSLPASPGHWNSPIVVGGRIILPTGNDNDHLTTGSLYIWYLPGR